MTVQVEGFFELYRFYIQDRRQVLCRNSTFAPRKMKLTNKSKKKKKMEIVMKTIDTAVLAGYNAGIERDRLRTGIGLIEFERTK